MNQRRHKRISVLDMDVDISDKTGISSGSIKNISRFGVCITGIPRKLRIKDQPFTVVISQGKHRFTLLLEPQWIEQDGLTTTTGATIANAPWDWTAMLIQMEPSDNNNRHEFFCR